jgi:hypothetical protein
MDRGDAAHEGVAGDHRADIAAEAVELLLEGHVPEAERGGQRVQGAVRDHAAAAVTPARLADADEGPAGLVEGGEIAHLSRGEPESGVA